MDVLHRRWFLTEGREWENSVDYCEGEIIIRIDGKILPSMEIDMISTLCTTLAQALHCADNDDFPMRHLDVEDNDASGDPV